MWRVLSSKSWNAVWKFFFVCRVKLFPLFFFFFYLHQKVFLFLSKNFSPLNFLFLSALSEKRKIFSTPSFSFNFFLPLSTAYFLQKTTLLKYPKSRAKSLHQWSVISVFSVQLTHTRSRVASRSHSFPFSVVEERKTWGKFFDFRDWTSVGLCTGREEHIRTLLRG